MSPASNQKYSTASPYEELYERNAALILTYIRRYISAETDAEDILVDVFLAVLEHEHVLNFEAPAQLAWLRRVAHNKCIDLYRQKQRRPTVSLERLIETVPFYERDEHSPEQETLRLEEYRILYEQLAHLPIQQQRVIHLRFGEDMRCVDIAQQLSIPEGTVRGWLSRSLNLLRTHYHKRGEI